jgi:hypothetical protein
MEQQRNPEGERPQSQPNEELPPDITKFHQLLFDFEHEIDQHGWDQPPALFALNHVDDHVVGIHQMHPRGLANHAGILVEAVTEVLSAPEISQDLPTILGPGYFGLLLTFEGWGRYGEAAATTDTNRSLADQVGSVECRVLLLRTVNGQQLMLRRIRGQEPTLAPQGAMGGALVDVLDVLSTNLDEALRRTKS